MNKFVKPNVYLVSVPSFDFNEFDLFMRDSNIKNKDSLVSANEKERKSAYHIIEAAARLCYNSYGRGRKSIKDFIINLISKKHGSIFEHVNFGFIVTGVSRSLTHELIRHRAGFSYSQLSQRYVDSNNSNYILPIQLQDINVKEFKDTISMIENTYQHIVDTANGIFKGKKSVNQMARSILPNAIETKIYITGNVRSWRHFFELRGSIGADPEIRQLALIMLDKLKKEAPLCFADCEEENGIIRVKHSKI